jgi:hypothetical protein
MQKYVGAVVDVCGVAAIRIFDAIPQFGDFRNILLLLTNDYLQLSTNSTYHMHS